MSAVLILVAFAIYCSASVVIAKFDVDLAVGFLVLGLLGLLVVVMGLSGAMTQ